MLRQSAKKVSLWRVAASILAPVTACVIALPQAAHAESAARHASGIGCTTSALTDVVDRTARVSGGASISCNRFLLPEQMMLVVFVELFRNGVKVAAATDNNTGAYGCYAGVEFLDNAPGKQKWQVRATFGGVWHETKWGNVLYH
ncbi:hypothetical protein ACQP2T_05450 [Nonomuraea sp. CA-143628]|uniref:hypothetical protein n=1 Tax=Nonomuraea sp. CA-143628 TaxID=3239997 RepID=UPI003D8AC8EF